MAKKQEEQVQYDEETGEIIEETPVVPDEVINLEDEFSLAVFKQYDQLIDLTEKVRELNEICPKMKLREVCGAPFQILEMKPFTSAYDNQDHAYHCYCQFTETRQMFRTVIGAGAIVEILDKGYNAGLKGGFILRVEWVQGGAFGGYYQLS